MIRNYLKIAWRNFKKNKSFTFINIFGLSIGLTCCMLIALYLVHETSYDSYHKNIDRLYQVGTTDIVQGREIRFQGCPSTLAGIFKAIYPQVEATARICRLLSEDKTLMQYHSPEGKNLSFYEEKGFLADSGFFRLFTYHFVEGGAESAVSGPYSIVISKDIADKMFGGLPALGKLIHVSSASNGEHEYTVTGVFQPSNAPSHIDGRFFLSMYGGSTGDFLRTNTATASNYYFVTYVLLKPGTDIQALEKQFPAFVDTYEGKDLKEAGFSRKQFLLPVRDIHLHANMEYGDITPSGSVTSLYILASIAVFTLLIACINFMNLATARSMKRAAEVGLRKALGAGRSSLIWQFLGESLLMAFSAFVIATCLTYLLLPAFERVSGKNIYFSGPGLLGLIGTFFGLTLVTGLIAGSYPAFYLSSFQPVKVLKGKINNSMAIGALRKGLVVFQFIVSIILIIASVVIGRQMHFLRTADPGFDNNQQAIVPLRSDHARKLFTTLRDEWKNNSNVVAVAGSAFYPGGYREGYESSFHAENRTARESCPTYLNGVDFDFMKTLNLKPVQGRIFSPDFPADSVSGVVLNEAAVNGLGYNPLTCIGKPVFNSSGGAPLTIVGVVKDFHFDDFHRKIDPMAFVVYSTFDQFSFMTVHIRGGDLSGTIASLEKSWHTLNPGEPFEYNFLDAQFQQHYESDARLAAIVSYFTAIAICISCLGLFGLATFSAEQRIKEIGIRKVLGASEIGIVALLSKSFLKLVALAILVGSPVAWYIMHKWLQAFAYRTDISWTVFAITTVAALSIAFITVSFQAVKAAWANPVKSLKTD
jgi:putative ABC transport system permease protein